MKKICVFCGSRFGKSPSYRVAARALGEAMAKRGLALVYGGGNVGLMGEIADAALAAGGEVIGVIPDFLMKKEVGHGGCTELHVVDSMHTRKAKMAELADAFVAMPGGFGTFDELFEIVTWGQLGVHAKPIGLLNIERYFDPLIHMVEHTIDEDFAREDNRGLLIVRDEVEAMLDALKTTPVAPGPKWDQPVTC
ncbi:TIGR00730 family Rossman fold protein [Chitinivorax sp. B]|uniref:LOG family protein n=1 Tax=Chitinivorax sp. B TaxID=2502235 RepID=UPI0010F886D3|nr:TIGR00730 family Rossman fold protein [Chitinivorax sp. B]